MSRIIATVLFSIPFIYATVLADDSDGIYGRDYWDNFSKNLNARINNQVRSSLRGLDNLGAQISQQVNEGLRPVREMQTRFRIIFGNDGTTIATYNDNKQFIIRNGVMYQCVDGTISQSDGTCSGTLQKENFQDRKDYCYVPITAIINNWYCIGNGNVNSGYINGQIYCNSNDGTPTLLVTADDYKNLCGTQARSVTYKYFTNKPIGDRGPEVQCTNAKPIVCTMTETLSAGNGRSSRTYIQVN